MPEQPHIGKCRGGFESNRLHAEIQRQVPSHLQQRLELLLSNQRGRQSHRRSGRSPRVCLWGGGSEGRTEPRNGEFHRRRWIGGSDDRKVKDEFYFHFKIKY